MITIDFDKKKSIRGTFGETLVGLGERYPNLVVLDADVASSTQTKKFANVYPDRFFDVGIAEQNMIATAAGLALTDKNVFAASFAVFATGRTYDQIRASVCYQNANVKIIGTHGGITVGEDGATHQALEDISLMRGLPNMTVVVPADCLECRQVIEYAAEHEGPMYIRISRNDLPDIYNSDYKFNPLKAVKLMEGADLTIISNGDVLSEACKAAKILKEKGIEVDLLSVPVVKPLDSTAVVESASRTKRVVVIENHSVNGGLGSAVCECLSENCPIKVLRIGINDVFGQSGTPSELIKHCGLDAESIVKRILETK